MISCQLCYVLAQSGIYFALKLMFNNLKKTHYILKMEQDGYRLADANAFGTSVDGRVGEVLIFVKETKETERK